MSSVLLFYVSRPYIHLSIEWLLWMSYMYSSPPIHTWAYYFLQPPLRSVLSLLPFVVNGTTNCLMFPIWKHASFSITPFLLSIPQITHIQFINIFLNFYPLTMCSFYSFLSIPIVTALISQPSAYIHLLSFPKTWKNYAYFGNLCLIILLYLFKLYNIITSTIYLSHQHHLLPSA